MNEGGPSLPHLPPTAGARSPPERKWPACLNRNQATAAQQDGADFVSLSHTYGHTHAVNSTPAVCTEVAASLFSLLTYMIIFLTGKRGRGQGERVFSCGMTAFHFMRATSFLNSSCGDVQGIKPKLSKSHIIYFTHPALRQTHLNLLLMLVTLQCIPFFSLLFSTPPLIPPWANAITAHYKNTYSPILSCTVTHSSCTQEKRSRITPPCPLLYHDDCSVQPSFDPKKILPFNLHTLSPFTCWARQSVSPWSS